MGALRRRSLLHVSIWQLSAQRLFAYKYFSFDELVMAPKIKCPIDDFRRDGIKGLIGRSET